MNDLSVIYNYLFGWLPNASWRIAFLGLFAFCILFIVLRIIKIVLDAIPFI